jgi:hypothetical protein
MSRSRLATKHWPLIALVSASLFGAALVGTVGSASAATTVTNTWNSTPVDRTKLPIGTVSTTSYGTGKLFTCAPGNGPGSYAIGPWVNVTAKTWNLYTKTKVAGTVWWSAAKYSASTSGTTRTMTSTDLPVGFSTGTFPIASSDPAYSYDHNPNKILQKSLSVKIPTAPVYSSTPKCLGSGAIGMLTNGVVIFAPSDAQNRDAAAYEVQDSCDGHPDAAGSYHYHMVPSCILAKATGSSTVVGYAYDGYPIVVERDSAGNLPRNSDLDTCHGRTSPVLINGVAVTTYHYSATYEFPYFMGCRHGSTVTTS